MEMKYFEFVEQEYWALVAADTVEKAYEVYAEEVAHDSAAAVKAEGEPREKSKVDAHEMYVSAIRNVDKETPIDELTNDFAMLNNTTVLITSELA